MIVELLGTEEGTRWGTRCGTGMVHAGVGYARVKERFSGGRAQLFVVHDGDGGIVCPLLLQPLPSVGSLAGACRLSDVTTPEYTGPYIVGRPRDATLLAQTFRSQFSEYCSQERVVTQFAHLHPWNCEDHCLEESHMVSDNDIVYVDLGLTNSELWAKSFNHACRKNIRKSEREGVKVLQATSALDIREFHRIYSATMDRNNAARAYYYPEEFFQVLLDEMRGQAVILLAEYRETIVAGTLYLHDDSYMYSYLGGADGQYQHVRPTNAVAYGAVQLGQSLGLRRLVLGGGHRAEDGIFRFKSTFSPLRARFRTYRRVLLRDHYERLCREAGRVSAAPSDGYFPAYRDPTACPTVRGETDK